MRAAATTVAMQQIAMKRGRSVLNRGACLMPLGVSAIRSMVGKSSMTLFTLSSASLSRICSNIQWSDLSDTASPCRARTSREMRVCARLDPRDCTNPFHCYQSSP